MGRDGQVFQRYSHRVQAFFTPDRADHFQGAGDQFQLLHADFAGGTPYRCRSPDSWFPQDPADVFRGEGGAGNGRRWRD